MFNNYPNYTYSGYPYTQNFNTTQPQSQSAGINWVQGEAGAKSYAIAPGQSVMLMDSENNVFYIKSTDSSGMPMPLRIFDYTERTQQKQQNLQPNNEYITRKEFEKRLSELKNNAKQSVQST